MADIMHISNREQAVQGFPINRSYTKAEADAKFGSGGTPAGSNGYIQFNNSGAFGGDSKLFWDNTNKRLGVGTSTPGTYFVLSQSVGAGDVTAQIVNTNTTGDTVLNFDQTDTGFANSFFIKRYGTTHVTKPSAVELWNIGNGYIDIATNNTQRIRINANGNIGIGNISPSELLSLGTSGTTKGVLSFAGNTSGKVIVQPAAAAGSWTLTLPTSAGTSGYSLTTNGAGVTTWSNIVSSQWTTSGSDIYYNTGKVSIGTTSGSYALNVSGAATSGNIARFTGNTTIGLFQVDNGDGSGDSVQFFYDTKGGFQGYNTGNGDRTPVEVGGFSMDFKTGGSFHGVSGNAYGVALHIDEFNNATFNSNLTVNGTFSNPSDARYKQNVTSLTLNTDKIRKLNPVSYSWNDTYKTKFHSTDTSTHMGFIAQDVAAILPELVSQDKDGFYTLQYLNFTPLIVGALQELDARLTAAGY